MAGLDAGGAALCERYAVADVDSHSHVFLNEMPRELATECVRAYNDWITEFCSADPRRLIPMTMLPFWDIGESVAEVKRARAMGHKGVLFAARYDKVGRRQIFGMYWFERQSLRSVIDLLAGNLMFETDFPHAISLSPGPASESPSPREVMERSLAGLPEETVGKVLQHTATRLYHLEPPVRDGLGRSG